MRNAIKGIASWCAVAGAILASPALAVAPANDNWANATVIGTLPFSVSNPGPDPDLTDATVEATDPDPLCLPILQTATRTVWYKYTTGASYEYVTLQSTVPFGDTTKPLVLFAVYTGTPGAFDIVSGGCNSVYDGPPPPPLVPYVTRISGLRLAPNTTYSIEVAVETAGGTGNTLDFTVVPAQEYHVTSTSDGDTGSCSPASPTVTNCASLRDAISASNANPGAVIIPAGIYKLSIRGAYDTDNHTGDLDAVPGMGIYGAGMDQTVITADTTLDPAFDDRILMLDPKQTAHMAYAIGDLTLANGTAPPVPFGSFLGFANSGGGLCVAGGGNNGMDFVGLERVAVKSSTAPGGGGIEFIATGTIRDSWIDGNATTSGDGFGGGIDLLSSRRVDISGTTISGNTGAGTGSGGGMSTFGDVRLVNSTVSGNKARGTGGGVNFDNGTVSVANSTIVHNTAFYDNPYKTDTGGGVHLDTVTISIVNSIIAYNDGGDPNLGGNPDPSYEDDCYLTSGTLTASYNIVQGPDNCPFIAGDTHIDPKLLPNLFLNGGLTPTHYLYADSPAIDAGDPTGCKDPDGLLLAYDQRGPGFPRVSGSQCDKGAIEWSNIIFQNGFEAPPP